MAPSAESARIGIGRPNPHLEDKLRVLSAFTIIMVGRRSYAIHCWLPPLGEEVTGTASAADAFAWHVGCGARAAFKLLYA